MILDATTRKLQVVLGEAKTTNDCAVVSSYFDSGVTPSGGPQLANTNGVTAVDIVAAPASGYIRQVNELTVFNADTVSHGVTVRYNDNGTTYTIQKVTLPPGYNLCYSKALSWTVQSPTGLFIAGQIPGTNTNDNAAAGMVGEIIPATATGIVLAGSDVPKTAISAFITPGDWSITGWIQFTDTGSAITLTRAIASISLTNNTLDTSIDRIISLPANGVTTAVNPLIQIADVSLKLSVTTTVFLVGLLTFSGGSGAKMDAKISARRVR